MRSNVSLSMGTVSGTMFSLIPNILSEDIVRTIILAVVGAFVSFAVSFVLKKCLGDNKKSGG